MSETSAEKSDKKKLWKPLVIILAVVSLIVVYRVFGDQIRDLLKQTREWIESTGGWAPAVFIAVYALGVVVCFPGTILTIGAGAMFGAVKGIIVVSLASTLGATLCFLIARYLARKPVEHWLQGKEKFQKLDGMTEEHGGMVLAITRLIPIFPFNLQNYGYGLTRVKLLTYIICSWLFMLPGTAAYVLAGAGASEAAKEKQIPWAIVIPLAIVVIILFVAARYGRAYLKKKMDVSVGELEDGGDQENEGNA
ncbi:MAG: TVP38/TMEM64 family protein [Planctomycetes bacterium]|nr:TVP38/TMEM64 family protein [Planctomycetota bacterium]